MIEVDAIYSLRLFRQDCGWTDGFHVGILANLEDCGKQESGQGVNCEGSIAQPLRDSALWPHFFPVEGQTLALALFGTRTMQRDVGLANFMARTLAMNPFLISLPKIYSLMGVSVFLRCRIDAFHRKFAYTSLFEYSSPNVLPLWSAEA